MYKEELKKANHKLGMINFKWIRRKFFWLFLVLVIVSLTGCALWSDDDIEKEGDDKIKIVVSVIPQKYFVEKIGGDKVDVTYMVEKGASPATYEPKPAQMQEISEADAYISIGVPFEDVWLDKFKVANDDLVMFDQGEGVLKLEIGEHEDGEGIDSNGHQGVDPHIWLSVKEASKQADNIFEALRNLDLENENYFRANLDSFKNEILELDKEITEILDSAENKNFLVFHPAFGYIARDYGLEQIAIEIEGKEPSVKEMEQIINIAKERNLKTVFIEPQFSKKSAEVVADQIGARVVEIDPLSKDWNENLRKIAWEIANE